MFLKRAILLLIPPFFSFTAYCREKAGASEAGLWCNPFNKAVCTGWGGAAIVEYYSRQQVV